MLSHLVTIFFFIYLLTCGQGRFLSVFTFCCTKARQNSSSRHENALPNSESYAAMPAEPGTGCPCQYTWPNIFSLSSLTQEPLWVVTHAMEETILHCESKAFPLRASEIPLQITLPYTWQACQLKTWHCTLSTPSIFPPSHPLYSTTRGFPPKLRQCYTGNAGHLCQTGASVRIKTGLKPALVENEEPEWRAALTILYLKAPSNFSPRWQDPRLSMTTTT